MRKMFCVLGVLVLVASSARAQVGVLDPPGYEGTFGVLLEAVVRTNASFSFQDYLGFVTDEEATNVRYAFVAVVWAVVQDGDGRRVLIVDSSCSLPPERLICVVFATPVYFPSGTSVLIWGRSQASFEFEGDDGRIYRVPFFAGDYWRAGEVQSWY